MKKSFCLSIIIIISGFLLSGCSSGKDLTGVWVNKEKIQGKSFAKLFIIVMTLDIQARVKIEKDLENVAVSRGYKVVKSIDVLPFSLTDPKLPTKEEIEIKIKESGCDGIFVAALLKKEEDIRYEKSSTAYSVMPYYSWSGSYFGFYSHFYPTVSQPGYFGTQKEYFIQSNLYDAASQEVMWAVQSTIFDPSSLNSFSSSYTVTLMDQLKKAKLLKK